MNSSLDYILVEPTKDDTEKRAYKYRSLFKRNRFPFVAAEVLSSDVKEIVDLFFMKESPAEVPARPLRAKSIDLTGIISGQSDVKETANPFASHTPQNHLAQNLPAAAKAEAIENPIIRPVCIRSHTKSDNTKIA